eukprot:SAG11_NODE_6006_length_1411_cov_2.456555_1_plen_132_part_00
MYGFDISRDPKLLCTTHILFLDYLFKADYLRRSRDTRSENLLFVSRGSTHYQGEVFLTQGKNRLAFKSLVTPGDGFRLIKSPLTQPSSVVTSVVTSAIIRPTLALEAKDPKLDRSGSRQLDRIRIPTSTYA